MPLHFDPSPDFTQVADGLETVTLRRRGSSVVVVIVHALRRAAATREATVHNRYDTEKEVASHGQLAASDLTWHLPSGELAAPPRLGDVILDSAGCRWTVLEVHHAAFAGRWQCMTRNLALAHGLDDTITILEATFAKGESGAAEATWRPWKTGIRARIQPAEADLDVVHHARRVIRRFRIFVEEDLALDHTHRIQGPNGALYAVRGAHGVQRIGELSTIDAEGIPWT